MSRAARYLCVHLSPMRQTWREGDHVVVRELPARLLCVSVPWIRRVRRRKMPRKSR